MVDAFGLALTHGLLLLAAWRLLKRPDLDADDLAADRGGWARLRTRPPGETPGA